MVISEETANEMASAPAKNKMLEELTFTNICLTKHIIFQAMANKGLEEVVLLDNMLQMGLLKLVMIQ